MFNKKKKVLKTTMFFASFLFVFSGSVFANMKHFEALENAKDAGDLVLLKELTSNTSAADIHVI